MGLGPLACAVPVSRRSLGREPRKPLAGPHITSHELHVRLPKYSLIRSYGIDEAILKRF